METNRLVFVSFGPHLAQTSHWHYWAYALDMLDGIWYDTYPVAVMINRVDWHHATKMASLAGGGEFLQNRIIFILYSL